MTPDTTRLLLLPLIAVACLTACTPDRSIKVTNDTAETVTIEELTGQPPPVPPYPVAITLPAGVKGGITLPITNDEKCSDRLNYRAVTPQGTVVGTLTHACVGDSWTISK